MSGTNDKERRGREGGQLTLGAMCLKMMAVGGLDAHGGMPRLQARPCAVAVAAIGAGARQGRRAVGWTRQRGDSTEQ